MAYITWPIIIIWDPLYGVGKDGDFKLGARIDRQAYNPKSAEVGQKKRGLRHVTYCYFWDPLYISGIGKAR